MPMSQVVTKTKQPKLPPASSFRRIADDLREKIRGGQLAAGGLLPGQRAIANEYGVSVGTVQQAVSQLLAEGLLRTEGGRGTFVADSDVVAVPPVAAATWGASRSPQADAPRARPVTLGIVAHLTSEMAEADVYNTWQRKVVHALERTLSEEGETQLRFFNLERPDGTMLPLREAVLALLSEDVDALAIVSPTRSMTEEEVDAVYAAVRDAHVPSVLISHQDFARPIPNVFYDSRIAGFQAASHLLRQGYERLIFVAPIDADWVEQRLEGAREAVRLAGRSVETLAFVPEEGRVPAQVGVDFAAQGAEAFQMVLRNGLAGAGVIAANDSVAIGLLRAAVAEGLTAGTDYGLVGFDDEPESRTLGLTSLHPPLEAMGREAGRLLLQAIHGEEDSMTMQLRLRSHLIARASSRPAVSAGSARSERKGG